MLPSTFNVRDLGDAGMGSGLEGDLRYAINTANSNTDLGNRIVFQPGLTGTITLVQGTLLVSKPLEVTITDSTITDNFATTSAGAISHGVGDLTISRCTIARNSALVNGGIVSVGGALYVSDATSSGNTSPGQWGNNAEFG